MVTVGFRGMEFFVCKTPDQLRGLGSSDESRRSRSASRTSAKREPRFHGFPFCVASPSAPSRGDHLKRRSSASNPPGASVQEEGEPGESRQPGHGTRQTRRTFKEQEARQTSQKGERQARPQAKGKSTRRSDGVLAVHAGLIEVMHMQYSS